jgi:hypothetical protein
MQDNQLITLDLSLLGSVHGGQRRDDGPPPPAGVETERSDSVVPAMTGALGSGGLGGGAVGSANMQIMR